MPSSPDFRFAQAHAPFGSHCLLPHRSVGLGREDLRARVVANKQVFFAAAWANYEPAAAGTFKLIPPPAPLDVLSAAYRAMQDMFFRLQPTWSAVIDFLTAVETRINGAVII